jgi:hypothetical protein
MASVEEEIFASREVARGSAGDSNSQSHSHVEARQVSQPKKKVNCKYIIF